MSILPMFRAGEITQTYLLAVLMLLLGLALPSALAEGDGYDAGLLFRLAPPDGGPSSCLFGTIHSEDPRVVALPTPVRRCLLRSEVLVLELVPDERTMAASAAAMRYDDGRTLADVLPPPLYQETVAALGVKGVPPKIARTLKPWAAATLLGMPRAETGEFLDLVLYRRAVAAAKPVLGLESVAEQLAVFEAFSEDEQRRQLRDTLSMAPELPALLAAVIDAYLRRDLARLMALGRRQVEVGDAALAARFRELLIDARNERMAERILSLLADGSHFIAVGALHLPGQTGLLRSLAAAGVRIERVY